MKRNWFKKAQEKGVSNPVNIERYGKFWAVFYGGELLGVVVYRKGAEAIKGLIEALGRGSVVG